MKELLKHFTDDSWVIISGYISTEEKIESSIILKHGSYILSISANTIGFTCTEKFPEGKGIIPYMDTIDFEMAVKISNEMRTIN